MRSRWSANRQWRHGSCSFRFGHLNIDNVRQKCRAETMDEMKSGNRRRRQNVHNGGGLTLFALSTLLCILLFFTSFLSRVPSLGLFFCSLMEIKVGWQVVKNRYAAHYCTFSDILTIIFLANGQTYITRDSFHNNRLDSIDIHVYCDRCAFRYEIEKNSSLTLFYKNKKQQMWLNSRKKKCSK